jgi:thiamine biosynthesis lipoprotein
MKRNFVRQLAADCRGLTLLAFLATIGTLVLGCAKSSKEIRLIGATMGTQYAITVADSSNGVTKAELRSDIEAMLEKINRLMSTYDSASEISVINRQRSTNWLAISDELLVVLSAAKAVHQISNGAFDVTVAPLVDLWGFGATKEKGFVPDPNAVRDARRSVGSGRFELRGSPPGLKKMDRDVAFDLSGIAKGYAVDEIAETLKTRGLTNFLVNIGGEMRASGTNNSGKAWRIGIETPTVGERGIAQTIALRDTGLASSGNYRNNFVVDGVQYGHTIDPTTGQPTQHLLLAASVIHPSAMIADAWSTALMSMGPDAALEVSTNVGVAAMLLRKNAASWQIITTAPFDEAVKQR